jgi:signal transduction histidine kinase
VESGGTLRGNSFVPLGRDITAILAGALVLLGLYLTSLHNYLLFHSLIEVFSIVVAVAIFMLAWNARRFLEDEYYLLFIGVAYLFVAGLDLLHTLAYEGMGVFEGADANLPTQLWVASRYVMSVSLLVAPLLLNRKPKIHYVLASFAVVTGLLLASIFYWHIFPDCYVAGVGLTPFKKISEYVISLTLLASIALLIWRRDAFDTGVLRLLVLSIVATVAAELAFTSYVSVYGGANLVGHFFKLVSYYFIYRAIIVTGLVRPYDLLFRHLKLSEEALRQQTLELQARNEDLDAFAHTAAHDLKNPLALIVSLAYSLDENRASLSSEELNEHVQIVKNTAFKMSNIIDELLLLAEVRKADVELEALDMAAAVAAARQRLAQMIEEYQGTIIVPSTWPPALGHQPWVEEVWVNYLSNAMKYGGCPPRMELGATPQPDGMVRFWVRDSGPGLPPEDLARLFNPFTRLSRIRASGHGLGLSIVRRIVEKLGGQVGAESQIDRGSLFFFTLPAVPGQAE